MAAPQPRKLAGFEGKERKTAPKGGDPVLLYTIMPEHVVFHPEDDEGETAELRYVGPLESGAFVLVEPVGNGMGRIVRWVSSNPQDYLDPSREPGRLVRLQGAAVFPTGSS